MLTVSTIEDKLASKTLTYFPYDLKVVLKTSICDLNNDVTIESHIILLNEESII